MPHQEFLTGGFYCTPDTLHVVLKRFQVNAIKSFLKAFERLPGFGYSKKSSHASAKPGREIGICMDGIP